MLVKKILEDFTKKRMSSTSIDNYLSHSMSQSVDVDEKVNRDCHGMNDITRMKMSQQSISGNSIPGYSYGSILGMNNVMNGARSATHRNMMNRYINDTLRSRAAGMNNYYEQNLLDAHERRMMDLQGGGYRRDDMYSNIGLNMGFMSNNTVPIRGFYQPVTSDLAFRSHPINASNLDPTLSNSYVKYVLLRERMLQEIIWNMNNSSTTRHSHELLGVNPMIPSDHSSRTTMNDNQRNCHSVDVANLTQNPTFGEEQNEKD